MPNITRGSRIRGLMGYLVGPGKENVHSEQHLVAGDSVTMAIFGDAVLDPSAAQAIADSLDLPRKAFGVDVTRLRRSVDDVTGEVTTSRIAADVWHCSLSLRAEEGQLSDETWAQIAEEFVDRMGFAGDSSGKADCRWVAVRHGLSTNGNDHIHLAVSLVREDGTKATTHNDFKRAQELCRDLETKYGLEQLESREQGLGERGVKPAEQEISVRRGAEEVGAHTLDRKVRAAATASLDEGEFVRRLRRANVLVRPRFAAGRDDVIAGYSVAIRPTDGTKPVWFGGGRLARDLTLPRLREGWVDTVDSAQLGVDEWKAAGRNPFRYVAAHPGREELEANPELWAKYTEEIGAVRDRLRSVPISDRATWAHVARETAGVFSAWSQVVEGDTPGPLADTARSLAKSAHLRAHQSRPKHVQLGSFANTTTLLLQMSKGGQGPAAELLLLRQLSRTTVALMDMHRAVGDARRAEELLSVMRYKIAAVTEERNAQITPPIATDGARATEAVRRATDGLIAPAPRRTVPPTNQPGARNTPVTPRERDGTGRE